MNDTRLPPSSILCLQCNRPLVEQTVTLQYLGHAFRVKLPRCPQCGQVYITPDLARGRMAQVEMELEDK